MRVGLLPFRYRDSLSVEVEERSRRIRITDRTAAGARRISLLGHGQLTGQAELQRQSARRENRHRTLIARARVQGRTDPMARAVYRLLSPGCRSRSLGQAAAACGDDQSPGGAAHHRRKNLSDWLDAKPGGYPTDRRQVSSKQPTAREGLSDLESRWAFWGEIAPVSRQHEIASHELA